MNAYPDVVLILTAFFAGAVFVVLVQSLRAHDPRVNLRARVIASVRLSNARREVARLREQLDLAWTAADRRLDLLRDVAQDLGADPRAADPDLDHDEALALVSRVKALSLRALCFGPSDDLAGGSQGSRSDNPDREGGTGLDRVATSQV